MTYHRKAHAPSRSRRVVTIVASAVALILAGAGQLAQAQSPSPWIATWAASPEVPADPVFGNLSGAITLNDQTIRQVVRISAGGSALQVRLSNEFTAAPTFIGSVHIALPAAVNKASGAIVPGSDRKVTFGGKASIVLAANAAAVSDPINMPVDKLTSLAVSIYVTSGTAPTTLHFTAIQTGYIVSGDQTSAADLSSGTVTTSRYLLSGVDAYVGAKGGATLVTLGDSVTDGFQSTTDQDHRWPDYLAERLQQRAKQSGIGVANAGMSANRVLADGAGPSAQSRFDRDVLAVPGARYVTVLEGINDIGFNDLGLGGAANPPTAEGLITAYRQLIARAHQKGLLIFGCTLTPFKGSSAYAPAGEKTREAVNDFIRTGGEFDGVIDFDQAIRDPNQPLRVLPAYDSGDHLHPNDNGYAAMADAVPLTLFH